MKTVVLIVPSGLTAANILRGPVFQALRAQGDRLRTIIVSPLVHDQEFVTEFKQPGVELHDLVMHRPGGLEARLLRLLQESHFRRYPTPGRKARRDEILYGERGRYVRAFIRNVLSRLPPRFWSELSDLLVPDRYYAHLFKSYRPDLVLACTPGVNFAELPLLKRARREKVFTMAVDTTWDQFTRLEPIRHIDHLIVWSHEIKRQAVELHEYLPDSVTVCGAPQFDIYAQPYLRSSRDDFFKRVGGDPNRCLITLATSCSRFYPHFGTLIEILSDAIKRDLLGRPAHLLVRPHPSDDVSQYEKYEDLHHVFVDRPYRPSVQAVGGLQVDVTQSDRLHLADTLCHSDVVVTIGSTVSIEACIFDRPTVVVVFDGWEHRPYMESVRRYMDHDQVRAIIQTGGIRLAWKPEELIEQVRHYLLHPESERLERRRIVAEQCGVVDGRAGERVAACILSRLEN